MNNSTYLYMRIEQIGTLFNRIVVLYNVRVYTERI